MTPSSSIRRRRSPEESSVTAGRVSPYSLSSRAVLSVIGSSICGGVRRLSFVSFALGKVYSKAFLTADHIIAYIDRIIVRLLVEYGSLVSDRLYALYDVAISYYSSVNLYSLALYA